MTVPSTIGSAVLVQSSSNISQSVTVPSGADTCLMFIGGWDSGGNTISTATLGGSSFTFINSENGDSSDQVYAYRLNSPSSGSQTLVVTYGSSWSEGATVYLVFFQDVDTSGDPIRDSDTAIDAANPANATTPAFNTDANDLVVLGVSSYDEVDGAPAEADTGAGQTEILNSGSSNSHGLAIGTKAGVSGTTTVRGDGAYIAVVGLSLKGSVAGGDFTLTAAQGSYTLTGQAATLTADRTIVAAQGSYTLTGQAAGLLADRLLTSAQGSYTLSGQAAGLEAARLLTSAQGSYALTGQDAGLNYGRFITADQGSYTLTGQDAGLLISRLLTAAQGSYALTGQAAGLLSDRLLAAGQGSYALTGQAAGLYAGRLVTAGQGSYTLTGQAAGLLAARLLASAQGSYT